ncbi:KilA-N domain-containing protein [Avibacterium paragallinarum]|uniref:Prophage antirepressor n=2 Tax=Avibacterium paragallinarum TaxID=728 RepID=A0A377IWB7_AVIPA
MSNIITADYNGTQVFFQDDAYLNATAIAKRFNKRPNDWLNLPTTQEYIEALSKAETRKSGNATKVEKSHFVKTVRGGKNLSKQGTWLHRRLAVPFARWLNVEFAIWCDEEIEKILIGQKQANLLTTENDTITPEEQRLIQNAVAATHQRTKMSYGEIWARVKNKFAVAKYEQIKRKDHRDVMIYIASMHPMQELPPNSIALDMENFYMLAKAMNYINHSVAAWERLEDLFSDLESHKNYKTAFNLGTASNRLAQALESFITKHTPFLKNASIREEIENLIFNSPRTEQSPTKTVNYLR